MTDILDTTDVEVLTVGWLGPLGHRVANTRRVGDPLPFLLVQKIPGTVEIVEESAVEELVQVDILCEKKDGEDAAMAVKDGVHRRMRLLARHLETDGTVDWMSVKESPFRFPYENDNVIRYTARYRFGQTYDQISS